MKKQFTAMLCILFLLLSGCASSERSDLEKAAEPIEKALAQEGYEKLRQTDVYDMTITDKAGSEIIYYICLTTYYAADPETVTGLDKEALRAVFSPEDAVLREELTIAARPAAYYQNEEKTYLCCTSSPEATLILEYDPELVPEEDILRIMESVFWENEEQAAALGKGQK